MLQPTWTYHLDEAATGPELEQSLQRWGELGWELVAAIPSLSKPAPSCTLIFKQPGLPRDPLK